MKRVLIISISQCMIAFAIMFCLKWMYYKDDKLRKRKQVYISYFYYAGGVIVVIGAIIFGVMMMLFPGTEGENPIYFRLLVLFDITAVIDGILILNWQINWKIIYDEKGFTYRSKWRKCYTFSYNDPLEIRRTRGFVYLYARGIKIRIDKRDARNWEPFMEILTDHQSKLQDQTVKKSKPEFSNKRYSRKMRKKKKGD